VEVNIGVGPDGNVARGDEPQLYRDGIVTGPDPGWRPDCESECAGLDGPHSREGEE